MESLLTVLFTDIDNYRTSGVSKLGNITTYKTLNTSSNNKNTVNTNNPVRINKIEDFRSNNNSSNSSYVNKSQSSYNQNQRYKVIDGDEEIVDIAGFEIDEKTKLPVFVLYTDGTKKYISTFEEAEAEIAIIKH